MSVIFVQAICSAKPDFAADRRQKFFSRTITRRCPRYLSARAFRFRTRFAAPLSYPRKQRAQLQAVLLNNNSMALADDEHELESAILASIIAALLSEYRDDIIAGDEQAARELKRELADALTEQLTLVGIAAGVALANQHKVNMRLGNAVALLLRQQAEDVAARIVETTQQRTFQAGMEATNGLELQDRLDVVFGPERAMNIGKTEVTRAETNGSEAARRKLERGEYEPEDGGNRKQVVLVAVWRHRAPKSEVGPGHPCPMCAPIVDKPEFEWPVAARGGPPHHPNCDCYVDYVAPESIGLSPNDPRIGKPPMDTRIKKPVLVNGNP